jgi:hypothetical protein
MTKIRSLSLAFFLAAGVTVFSLQYHAYAEEESPIKVGPKGEIEVGGTKIDEQGNIYVDGIGMKFASNGDIYGLDGTKLYDAATDRWADGVISLDCEEVDEWDEVVLKQCWWKEKGIWNARAVAKNESSISLDVIVKCGVLGGAKTELHDVLSPGEEDDFDYSQSFPTYEGKKPPNWYCHIEKVQVHTPKPKGAEPPEA